MAKQIIWTSDEIKVLKRHYPTHTVAELKKNFFSDRSISVIKNKISALGLTKKFVPNEQIKASVVKLYPYQSTASIAAELNISVSTVNTVAKNYKLKKDPAYLADLREKQNQELAQNGIKNRFVKGMPSKFKGKKITEIITSPDALERVKKNWFVKGQTAPNLAKIGTIRGTRFGYYEIKTEHGWQFIHHLIWEQRFGAIPKDSRVCFIDSNPGNLTIENLCLKTKAQVLAENRMKDEAIAKRMLRTQDPKIIGEFIESFKEVIQLKRSMYQFNQAMHGKS